MTTMDTLLSRVSVSALRDPAPAGRDLGLILESGLRAPDHGRLRPWHFVLIRGDARAAFAEAACAAMRLRDPEAPLALLERQRGRLEGVPLIIALGARIRPGHKIPEIEQMLAVGAAAMNMLNALHALGYGGIWVTGANSYDPRMLATLGMEPTDRLAGFLFTGTPKEVSGPVTRPDPALHVTEWTGQPASTVPILA